jgi:hypothetical protein
MPYQGQLFLFPENVGLWCLAVFSVYTSELCKVITQRIIINVQSLLSSLCLMKHLKESIRRWYFLELSICCYVVPSIALSEQVKVKVMGTRTKGTTTTTTSAVIVFCERSPNCDPSTLFGVTKTR